MAADTSVQLPVLKPEKKAPPRVLKTAEDVHPPQVEIVDVPEGAVMMLPNGDWCHKDAALEVLYGEGKRAANKSAKGIFSEVNGGGGAAARERSLRDIWMLLKRDDLKGISRKLYGHDKAKWFRLEDITHPEVRAFDDKGEPVEVEPQWEDAQ